MATRRLVILAAACVCACAFPMEPMVPMDRNTIFADEKFEGQVFENLDEFNLLEAAVRNTNDNSSAYRLPTTTKPTHYNIFWKINMTTLAFDGNVDIQLYATRPGVNEIVIHSSELNLTSIALYLGAQSINITEIEEEETQFLRVRLANASSTLGYNETNRIIYNLRISFNASLRTDMYGIYQNWFRNNASDPDDIHYMASTQFQATAARWAFPCYDEPAFKATFNITIRRPTTFTSWSCTSTISNDTNYETGYVDDVYATTPTMSTYLLALVVAEYEPQEYRENEILKYEVIARPGAIAGNQSEYAFDTGRELLRHMSAITRWDYYDVSPNSITKMTQAAIPDFGAGAMENWGLLTYREAYLMVDDNHTNSYFKQLIANIISHEIAHMWYGNLVTCDWWDVLWLNEGFARYYQYFLTDTVEEEMGFETRFIVEQVHTSLLSDSANNPHPLSTTSIGNRDSVSAMFSTLSYNKGASIIRQTEHLLGKAVHDEGLANYLRNKAFDTALPIDLFEALQNVSVVRNATSQYGPNFNVIDYYKSWTEQPGHPLLSVQVNHQTGEMVIYQRRFNINTGYSPINNNYIIPITFATARNTSFNDTKPTHVIRNAVTVIQRGFQGDGWVIFNKQQTGFYRVNYDDYTWDLIVLALRNATTRNYIHEYNRAQIVNDVFQFARSGLMSYNRAFSILSFLEYETAYAPWVAAIAGFTWIRNRLAGTEYLSELDNLIIDWSQTVITELGYYPRAGGESWMESYLRYQLAPTLCIIDAPGCRDAAFEQYQRLLDSNATVPYEVPNDSRNWVYCNALRIGDESDFYFLYDRFLSHPVYNEKIQLLMVLGCTPHAAALRFFLDEIVDVNYRIRRQDYTTAWNSAVTGNENNTQIVFQYVKDNLENVTRAFDGSATLPLSYISSRLRNIEEINEFQQWANEARAELGNDYNAVYQGAEASRESIQWATAVENDMKSFFNDTSVNISTTTSTTTTSTPPVTLVPENLVQPSTPEYLPLSAASATYVSVLLLAIAALTNFIF